MLHVPHLSLCESCHNIFFDEMTVHRYILIFFLIFSITRFHVAEHDDRV